MQVYVPNSTSTTFPLRSAGVSGSEWSHEVAPARGGASRSIGKDLVPGPARRDPFPSLAAVLASAPGALASTAARKTRAALMRTTVDTMGRRRRNRRRARRPAPADRWAHAWGASCNPSARSLSTQHARGNRDPESHAADVQDGLGELPRGLLGKIVPNAPSDEAVLIAA